MNPRILLLGSTGQVGRSLANELAGWGFLVAPTRRELDVTDADATGRVLQQVRPDIVINATAYTQVDRAEIEADLADAVNHRAVATLATLCRDADATLVHYSTDYVYHGEGEVPWVESAAPRPLNAYGRSKLAGDLAIAATWPRHFIFRTSWVYSPHGNNFAKAIASRGRRGSLRVVADQWGAPTSASLLARATRQALGVYWSCRRQAPAYGLYHLCCRGETTWHGFAREIVAAAKGCVVEAVDSVTPIATTDWPTPALRPCNSRLGVAKFEAAFGISLPDWRNEWLACQAAVVEAAP